MLGDRGTGVHVCNNFPRCLHGSGLVRSLSSLIMVLIWEQLCYCASDDNAEMTCLLCWQGHLNSSQMSAVNCITNAVLQPYASSKICLLQGPPGTGKSLTTIALIENILTQVTYVLASSSCDSVVSHEHWTLTSSQRLCRHVRTVHIHVFGYRNMKISLEYTFINHRIWCLIHIIFRTVIWMMCATQCSQFPVAVSSVTVSSSA